MSANFARLKVWSSTEDVTAADLNAEFDNILQNLGPAGMSGYSTNVPQMQATTDPGEVGTESLATTLAGEIERLRFIIKEITGEAQWYASPPISLNTIANILGTGATNNRLVSGRVRTTSQQPLFLKASGAARTVSLLGATTPFIYNVDGEQYTISSDITATNLTLAPASNNTCQINDTIAADQAWTKHTGEDGTSIPVDNMGSEITGLIGKWAAFGLNNGSATEYFLAYVDSSTKLSQVRRGNFFNSSDAPVPRVVYSNNDVITLMKLTWLFVTNTGTLAFTYNNPVWSDDEPAAPSFGDYWFDLSTLTWKVYDSTVFVAANATLAGVCFQDTANTIGSRSFEFGKTYTNKNTAEIGFLSTSTVRTKYQGAVVDVWGSDVRCDQNYHSWDMSVDLDTGISEAASTRYYFYLTETGDTIISDIKPHDRTEDLGGQYHPFNSWKCLGYADNSSGSDFSERSTNSYFTRYDKSSIRTSVIADGRLDLVDKIIPLDNGVDPTLVVTLPPAADWTGRKITLVMVDNSAPTTVNTSNSEEFLGETYNMQTSGQSTDILYNLGDTVEYTSLGDKILVKARRVAAPKWSTYTPTFTGFGTVANVAFRWRMDGQDVLIEGKFTAGTVTGVEARMSLPNSFTAVSLIPSFSIPMIAGVCTQNAASTTYFGSYTLWESAVAYITFSAQTSTAHAQTKTLANVGFATGRVISLTARVTVIA